MIRLAGIIVVALRLSTAAALSLLHGETAGRVLVVHTDDRELELSALRDGGDNGTVGFWTSNFLNTVNASIRGEFDFKYFRCIDERPELELKQTRIPIHWCKAVVLNRIANEGAYDDVIVLDSDAYAHSVEAGQLQRIFDVFRSGREFLVPDVGSKSFRNASLANKSLITEITGGCGFGTAQSSFDGHNISNKHCTAVIFARVHEAREMLQAWLHSLKHGLKGPFYDQTGFNSIVPSYGSGMEVLASDLVKDAKGWRNEKCKDVYHHNAHVVKDALGIPPEAPADIFFHRAKLATAVKDIKKNMAANLGAVLARAGQSVAEIEIGHTLQQELSTP